MRKVNFTFVTENNLEKSFTDLVQSLNPTASKVKLAHSHKFRMACSLGVLDLSNTLLTSDKLNVVSATTINHNQTKSLISQFNLIKANDTLLIKATKFNIQLPSFQYYLSNQTHLALGKTYQQLICVLPLSSNLKQFISRDFLRLAGTLQAHGSLEIIFVSNVETLVKSLTHSYLNHHYQALVEELEIINPYYAYLCLSLLPCSSNFNLQQFSQLQVNSFVYMSDLSLDNSRQLSLAQASYQIFLDKLTDQILTHFQITTTQQLSQHPNQEASKKYNQELYKKSNQESNKKPNSLQQVHILLGERGTGKTTILLNLITNLSQKHINVYLIAPYQRDIYYQISASFLSLDQLIQDLTNPASDLYLETYNSNTNSVFVIDEVGTINLEQLIQILKLLPAKPLILASTIDGYEGTTLGLMHKLLKDQLLPLVQSNLCQLSLNILNYHFRDQADSLSQAFQKLAGISNLVEFINYQVKHYAIYQHPNLTIYSIDEKIVNMHDLLAKSTHYDCNQNNYHACKNIASNLIDHKVIDHKIVDNKILESKIVDNRLIKDKTTDIGQPKLSLVEISLTNFRKFADIYQFAKLSFLNHYRATSSDFEYMFRRDESKLVGFYDQLINQYYNQSDSTKTLVGGIQFICEDISNYSLSLKQNIIQGIRKPQGNLSLQYLIKTYGLTSEFNSCTSAYRVSRIFIDPAYRPFKLTSTLLTNYTKQLSQNNHQVKLLTVSFSYTPKLYQYWHSQGYQLLGIATNKTASSGQYSVIVATGLNAKAQQTIDLLALWQGQRLVLNYYLAQNQQLISNSEIININHHINSLSSQSDNQSNSLQDQSQTSNIQINYQVLEQLIISYQQAYLKQQAHLSQALCQLPQLTNTLMQCLSSILTSQGLSSTRQVINNSSSEPYNDSNLIKSLSYLHAYFTGKLDTASCYAYLAIWLEEFKTSHHTSLNLLTQNLHQQSILTAKVWEYWVNSFLTEILSKSSLELLQLGTSYSYQEFYVKNSPDYQLLLQTILWQTILTNQELAKILNHDNELTQLCKLTKLDTSNQDLTKLMIKDLDFSQKLTGQDLIAFTTQIYEQIKILNYNYWHNQGQDFWSYWHKQVDLNA